MEGLTNERVPVTLFPAREGGQGDRARGEAGAAPAGLSLSSLLPYGGAAVLLLLLMAGFWMLRERRWRMRSEEE